MAGKNSRAKVAPITIGTEQFEGLMDVDGQFYVALSQVGRIFSDQFLPKNVARDVERLLGKDFNSFQIHSELSRRAVSVVDLRGFNLIIKRLARKGDPKAVAMDESLSENSLREIFCDGFGIATGTAERVQFLKDKMESIECRDELTDTIQGYCERHPELSEMERGRMYCNATDRLYKILTGVRARELRMIHGLEKGANVREWLRQQRQRSAVRLISGLEVSAAALIETDVHPLAAISAVAEMHTGKLSHLMNPIPKTA